MIMLKYHLVDTKMMNELIQNIYADAELTAETTIRNIRIVQTDGSRQVNRQIKALQSTGYHCCGLQCQ